MIGVRSEGRHPLPDQEITISKCEWNYPTYEAYQPEVTACGSKKTTATMETMSPVQEHSHDFALIRQPNAAILFRHIKGT